MARRRSSSRRSSRRGKAAPGYIAAVFDSSGRVTEKHRAWQVRERAKLNAAANARKVIVMIPPLPSRPWTDKKWSRFVSKFLNMGMESINSEEKKIMARLVREAASDIGRPPRDWAYWPGR